MTVPNTNFNSIKVFVCLLFLSTTLAAQRGSQVNIWLGSNQLQSETYYLFVNNRRISSFKPQELLTLQLYSSGFFNIEIVQAKSGNLKYAEQFNLEPGKNYFLHANTTGYPPKPYVQFLDKEEFKKFDLDRSYFKDRIFFEEDISDPLGRILEKPFNRPAQATGFLLNQDGYLITNFHVVEDANKVTVYGVNGDLTKSLDAKVVAVDQPLDLALLKLELEGVQVMAPPYTLIKSNASKKGEFVFTLGYPVADLMGIELKVTDGIVSSTKGIKNSISNLQFSAPVQPGNSGGPLINNSGEIVGIISSKLSHSQIEGVAYALKSDFIFFFLNQTTLAPMEANNGTNLFSLNMPLSEKVEALKPFIYLIRTE